MDSNPGLSLGTSGTQVLEYSLSALLCTNEDDAPNALQLVPETIRDIDPPTYCLICGAAGLNRYPTPFFSLNELLTVEKIKRFYTEMSISCCKPIYRPSGDQQRKLFVSKGHS